MAVWRLAHQPRNKKPRQAGLWAQRAVIYYGVGHANGPSLEDPQSHGGVCSSVLDTNPRGMDGGVRRGGGGECQKISHFGGIFESPVSM